MLLLIAWRNLWRRKTRSLLILLSVAVGMWAGAFIVAIYYGMGNSRLRIAIDNEVSHLQVHHPRFGDDQQARYSFSAERVEAALSGQPWLKAYSLRSIASGMLANASGSRGVQVNGINAVQEHETRGLKQFVKKGVWFDTSESNRILVSTKLAGKLNLQVKSKVVLTLLDTADHITAGAFRVCGLYETQNSSEDELNVFVLKKDLDRLIGTPGRVHEAAVLLQEDEDLEVAEAWLGAELSELEVKNWKDISPETALVINSLDTYNLIFIAIILLALSFGIVNTMLMAVLERIREIGVLMALGMSRLRLFGMILLETILLTIIGAPLGILIAYLTVLWVGQTGIDMTSIAGDTLRDFGYAAVIFPELPGHSVWQILQLVFVAAVLSAIYPAWKAVRLHPVEAIQGI